MIDGVIRRLDPKECMRITGFPEDFLLHPNRNVSYRQFGNSVVVNVLKAIISNIIKTECLKFNTQANPNSP